MMCKLKEWMDKGGHYDVEIERVDGTDGIMMCKLMDNGGQYDVEIKGWIQKGAIMCDFKWADG